MIKFFKESIKEFEHVVWPTKKETRKYFSFVVGLIVALTIFLSIVGTLFSAGLWAAKDAINPSKITPSPSNQNFNIDDLQFSTGSVSETGAESQTGTEIQTGSTN